MLETPDDQQQRAWEAEQRRIAQLIPGARVRVYLAGGAGFTKMKIVGVQTSSIQDSKTKRWTEHKIFQLEDAYGNTYIATADFIESMKPLREERQS